MLSQQSIRSYGATEVYWERQHNGAMCAMHAINSLLQRRATTQAQLRQIAGNLDGEERGILGTLQPCEDSNARPEGDYTIQVIHKAFAELRGSWTITDARNPGVREAVSSKPPV